MKILLVIPEYPPDFGGGIVSYYRDLVPAFRSLGCEVSILKGSAFVHGERPYEQDEVSVSVLETARADRWLDRFAHFSMFPELRRHLAAAFALHEQAQEGEGFDMVEVTDWGMLFLPWVTSAKARVLVQMHGSTGQIAYHEPVKGREVEGMVALLLEKAALDLAPGLSSYSHANVRWWEAIVRRTIEYTPPPLAPLETNASADGEKWLAVGRIQRWKGPQVACAAWELLNNQAPTLEWMGRDTVSGETAQSTSILLSERFPKTWGKRIMPIGQMPPEKVRQCMRTAKAILVPSTWDVFNLATAEAMAAGKPVVVSNGAGAADLVEHGVNGFVFENNDARQLAKLVREIEGLSSERLRKIGERAAATVRERLNPARIAAEKLSLYKRLSWQDEKAGQWIRDCLLSATGASALSFLDSLPLKGLGGYVAQRGIKKILGRNF